jgi:hypothetical protein
MNWMDDRIDLPQNELDVEPGEQLERDRRLLADVTGKIVATHRTTEWETAFLSSIKLRLARGVPLSAKQRVALRGIGEKRP